MGFSMIIGPYQIKHSSWSTFSTQPELSFKGKYEAGKKLQKII